MWVYYSFKGGEASTFNISWPTSRPNNSIGHLLKSVELVTSIFETFVVNMSLCLVERVNVVFSGIGSLE